MNRLLVAIHRSSFQAELQWLNHPLRRNYGLLAVPARRQSLLVREFANMSAAVTSSAARRRCVEVEQYARSNGWSCLRSSGCVWNFVRHSKRVEYCDRLAIGGKFAEKRADYVAMKVLGLEVHEDIRSALSPPVMSSTASGSISEGVERGAFWRAFNSAMVDIHRAESISTVWILIAVISLNEDANVPSCRLDLF